MRRRSTVTHFEKQFLINIFFTERILPKRKFLQNIGKIIVENICMKSSAKSNGARQILRRCLNLEINSNM
jgi:hypothetical protein